MQSEPLMFWHDEKRRPISTKLGVLRGQLRPQVRQEFELVNVHYEQTDGYIAGLARPALEDAVRERIQSRCERPSEEVLFAAFFDEPLVTLPVDYFSSRSGGIEGRYSVKGTADVRANALVFAYTSQQMEQAIEESKKGWSLPFQRG